MYLYTFIYIYIFTWPPNRPHLELFVYLAHAGLSLVVRHQSHVREFWNKYTYTCGRLFHGWHVCMHGVTCVYLRARFVYVGVS